MHKPGLLRAMSMGTPEVVGTLAGTNLGMFQEGCRRR